jgi:hypothetical protein
VRGAARFGAAFFAATFFGATFFGAAFVAEACFVDFFDATLFGEDFFFAADRFAVTGFIADFFVARALVFFFVAMRYPVRDPSLTDLLCLKSCPATFSRMDASDGVAAGDKP